MPDHDLTDRQKQILKIVVQEYVDSAQPIGSSTIVEQYNLGVSPATVRKELAALEQAGLLTHPHTSAGRIPTDAGYRYFVRNLLNNAELPVTEQRMIRHQFHQARHELDQWLRLSTAVLARVSHGAALATMPRARHSRFKHLELVGIRDTAVLLVLVLQEGTVKQQLLTLDGPVSQQELSAVSNELNQLLAGADAEDIGAKEEFLTPLAQQVAMLVVDMMSRLDGKLDDRIYRDGLAQVLEAPEFSEGQNIRKIVRVLEQRSLLQQILGELTNLNDVQVIIAGEGRFAELENISLVLGCYGVEEHTTGVLGVIGPVRMPYGRTIGAVRYVSSLMSDLMHQIYGS
jgi:heat-inducible transcriptional repressor